MFGKIVGVFVCLALLISLSGCLALFGAAAGGAGTAFWLGGKLSSQVEVSYERATEAAKRALASLNMPVKKDTRAEDVTQLISEYSDGREVWIDIRPLSQSTTKIEVRVGMRGDKAASSRVMERIKQYL